MKPAVEIRLFPTTLGWTGFLLANEAVTRVVMGHESQHSANDAIQEALQPLEISSPTRLGDEIASLFQNYLVGEAVNLQAVPFQIAAETPFQKAVRDYVRAIPPGQTQSYGEVAAGIGRAGAARAVGRVMATNPVPLLIPCHRVVGSKGSLGGFSAPTGLLLKTALLELEQTSQRSQLKPKPVRSAKPRGLG